MPLKRSFIHKTNNIGRSIGQIGTWAQKQHDGNMLAASKFLQGKKNKNALSVDRLVEACYVPRYANLLIQLADKHFMGEQPRFVTAVNWLECALSQQSSTLGFDIDWGDADRPNCTAFAIAKWAEDTFVHGRGPLPMVNLDYGLRDRLRAGGNFTTKVRLLQKAKLYVASGFIRDFGKSLYVNQVPYVRNIFDFNSKLLRDGHSSDCGARIQAVSDKAIGDGRLYSSLTEGHGQAL